MIQAIDTIVFDLGGVLIDWNPRHYYREVFESEEEMEYFLSEICNNIWNEQQDAGRKFADATTLLAEQYPKYREQIMGYDAQWEKMMKGTIDETVNLLNELKANGRYKIYALTNWSSEKFPFAYQKFDFFRHFDGMVVSGEIEMIKPNEDIFQHLFEKFSITPSQSVFIDDNARNIETAQRLGMHTIHFTSPERCKAELANLLREE